MHVVPLLTIKSNPFLLRTPQQTPPMLFHGPDNTQKSHILVWDLNPIEYMVHWAHAYQSVPRRNSKFAQPNRQVLWYCGSVTSTEVPYAYLPSHLTLHGEAVSLKCRMSRISCRISNWAEGGLRNSDIQLSLSILQYVTKQVPPVKGTDGYPHMPILRPFAARRFVRFRASGTAKFPKMGDSLPRTPMNLGAKFEAASFILAG